MCHFDRDIQLLDNFGNDLSLTSIEPIYFGENEGGLRQGEEKLFTLKFREQPLKNTIYLLLKIPKNIFGNIAPFELKILSPKDDYPIKRLMRLDELFADTPIADEQHQSVQTLVRGIVLSSLLIIAGICTIWLLIRKRKIITLLIKKLYQQKMILWAGIFVIVVVCLLSFLDIEMENGIFALIGVILGSVGGIVKDLINNQHDLNKIRFSNLQEKQACVVAELYSRIVEVNEKAMACFSPVGTMKPDERLPLTDALGDAIVEFLKFYRPNEIYISDSTCKLIDELANASVSFSGKYSIYLRFHQDTNNGNERKEILHQEREAWKEGYDSLQKNGTLSNILKELKAELRNLIGVK
jgi:hypothetical protein